MRLIDADALIMALRLEYPMMPMFKENQKEWGIKTEGYRKAEEVIKDAPTIEPKRGEWHRSLSDCEEGWVTCNNCGMQFDYYLLDQLGAEIENVYFTNFCPNCGADMRGADQ